MKKFLALAFAVTALAFFGTDHASAQGYNNGFFFGTGVNQAFRGGGSQFTAPPYFAQFPPVYYNGIVRRPYGISPFAAPPGIVPVESHYIPEDIAPITITNPYMNNIPASSPAIKSDSNTEDTTNKTTWTSNPYCRPTTGFGAEFASIVIN